MIKKWIKTAVLLLALPVATLAQTRQEYDVKYQNAKQLLEMQRYELAMQELLPLTNPYPENSHAPEASYFYTLAALKAGKLQEARQMLAQIRDQHQDWANYHEARYLMAYLAFEQKDYEKALEHLQQIKAPATLATDAAAMKRSYLSQINDKLQLQYLHQRFPEDKDLARIYADKLRSGWYSPEDLPVLEQLVQKFNLDPEKYIAPLKSSLKEEYKVALLLPFNLHEVGDKARPSQFVADLHAGILMAHDSLQKTGTPIKLFHYDTSADTNQVKEVLLLPELRQMDLIIGPIYKNSSRIVSRFAQENNINVLNPLTQDLELAENNPNLFLFENSTITQAKKAAEFAYQQLGDTVVIAFDKTRDDTTFALHYRNRFLELGGVVKAFQPIESKKTNELVKFFMDMNLEEANHLVVASSSAAVAVNTLSMLESKVSDLPLLTYANWLEVNQLTLEQLDKNEVYFIHPKYIEYTAPAASKFKKQYIKRYNLPPTVYSYSGYEMMFYFGKLLQNYGSRFNTNLNSIGFVPGVIYKGFLYGSNSVSQPYLNDNQYFPITKLEGLQLEVKNPPAATAGKN